MRPLGSVVVTGAGTPSGMDVIKALIRQNEFPVRIVSCDSEPLSAGAFIAHAFHRVPTASDPSFTDALMEICAREHARLLIPIPGAEGFRVASERKRFLAAGVQVAVSGEDTLEICDDRESSARLFRALDIPVPRTWFPYDREPDPADFPLALRPRRTTGTTVQRVEDQEAYDFHLKRAGDCVVQELIDGKHFAIDTLSDFDGRVLAVVPRLRLETESGVSRKGVIVRDERMMALACRVIDALHVVGGACILCTVRQDALYFMEVIPRFGAGASLTFVGAGVNMPVMLARAAWGQAVLPRIGQFRDGATLLRYWDEVVVPAAAAPPR